MSGFIDFDNRFGLVLSAQSAEAVLKSANTPIMWSVAVLSTVVAGPMGSFSCSLSRWFYALPVIQRNEDEKASTPWVH